jgi:hypothetical protein
MPQSYLVREQISPLRPFMVRPEDVTKGKPMFALIIVPVTLFWSVENSVFLSKVTDVPWEFVGYTVRMPDPAVETTAALTM